MSSIECDEAVRDALATDLNGAVEQLVQTYQDRLYRFALRSCANAQDAEEIVQDAFVRAHKALTGYCEERIRAMALRPWLYRITLNVARNRARKKLPINVPLVVKDETATGRPQQEPVAAEHERPDAVLERAQVRTDMAERLAVLPERYRVALVLRYIEDLSYEEAAMIVERPVGTMKSDVHRGLALLRKEMESCGGEGW